jgi:hypothetical protein
MGGGGKRVFFFTSCDMVTGEGQTGFISDFTSNMFYSLSALSCQNCASIGLKFDFFTGADKRICLYFHISRHFIIFHSPKKCL